MKPYASPAAMLRAAKRKVLMLPPPSALITARPGWEQHTGLEYVDSYTFETETRKIMLRGRADRGWEFIVVNWTTPIGENFKIIDRGAGKYLGKTMELAEKLLHLSTYGEASKQ